MKTMIEVCCGSYYDALQAEKGGAKRIELNSALHLGGLTPSETTLRKIKENTSLEVACMVRPRGAGFCYDAIDFEVMLAECDALLALGSDAIVFGFLKEDFSIHEEYTKQMVQRIHKAGKQAVFHRAFDCCEDPFQAMQTLIDLGVDRVLTSGAHKNVSEGKEILKQLQTRFGEQIEILAGCGVNAKNAKELVEHCGISQLHSSCKSWLEDPTTISSKVSYAYQDGNLASCYEVVDSELVKDLIISVS